MTDQDHFLTLMAIRRIGNKGLAVFHQCKGILLVSVAVMMSISAPIHAATWCSGVTTSVLLDQNGYVQAEWGFSNTMLCSVNEDVTPPAPSTAVAARTCQSLYSMLLTALFANKIFKALVEDTNCPAFGGNGSWPTRKITTYDIDR